MAERNSFTVGCLAGPRVRKRLRALDIEFECINQWPYETYRIPSTMEFTIAMIEMEKMDVLMDQQFGKKVK